MSMPIALDTNLLARRVTNDDPQPAEQVADLIDSSTACFVPITVVLELEWVLRGAYKLPPAAVIHAFEGLMDITQLHLEQQDLVRQALEHHRQGLDFADALHLLRSEGCGAFLSFDRSLAQQASKHRLSPAVQHP